MKLAVDLHIHSCLSACANDDMTPNNIVNMAYLKGLDVLAVADHNSAKNLPAVEAVAKERGLLLLPAIEVESKEEVHILCYLKTVQDALALCDYVYAGLNGINVKEVFGNQLIMNEDDELVAQENLLLSQATSYSIEQIAAYVKEIGGVALPAHINRQSNSLLYNLGFIPPGLFASVEISKLAPVPSIDISAYHVVHSSDAHDLSNIFERDNFLELPERSTEAILEYLRSQKAVTV